jgi:DNA-binding MarR family transcriptional regulator
MGSEVHLGNFPRWPFLFQKPMDNQKILMLALVFMAPRANSSVLTQTVIRLLMAEKKTWFHAYQVAQLLETRSGTVSNILNRLEKRGWLECKWETRRKLFRPTTAGAKVFENLIWGISPDGERNA